MDIVSQLLDLAAAVGGWTRTLAGEEGPDTGYAVGGCPGLPEQSIDNWSTDRDTAVQSLHDYLDRIRAAGQTLTGGWVEGDALVLDSPTVIADLAEALELAQSRGERAIYCLHTGETITV